GVSVTAPLTSARRRSPVELQSQFWYPLVSRSRSRKSDHPSSKRRLSLSSQDGNAGACSYGLWFRRQSRSFLRFRVPVPLLRVGASCLGSGGVLLHRQASVHRRTGEEISSSFQRNAKVSCIENAIRLIWCQVD